MLVVGSCASPAEDPKFVLAEVPTTPPTLAVEVGTGTKDFMALADGDLVDLTYGPQGGFHIWTAVRVRNAGTSGVQINLRAKRDDGTLVGPASRTAVSLEAQEDGGATRRGSMRPICSRAWRRTFATAPIGDTNDAMRSTLLAATIVLVLACSKKAPPAPGQIDITANDKGFQPSSVTVKKGARATLVFTRTTDDTCATEVVFPELSLKKDLPKDQPVAIPVPSDKEQTLTFQCGMGMYKSSVVIVAN